jgi:hypothetical protein
MTKGVQQFMKLVTLWFTHYLRQQRDTHTKRFIVFHSLFVTILSCLHYNYFSCMTQEVKVRLWRYIYLRYGKALGDHKIAIRASYNAYRYFLKVTIYEILFRSMVSIKNRNLIKIIVVGLWENSIFVYLELERLYPPGIEVRRINS